MNLQEGETLGLQRYGVQGFKDFFEESAGRRQGRVWWFRLGASGLRAQSPKP